MAPESAHHLVVSRAVVFSPDGTQWVTCRPGFFLPVRVLSRLFRRLLLQLLQAAYDAEALRLEGSLAPLQDRPTWTRALAVLQQTDWASTPSTRNAESLEIPRR